MIERSTVIPWGTEPEGTLKRLQDAGDVVLTELRELFPEAEGFEFKVGKQGMDIQVRRGLTWGLYVVIKGTGKGLKLKVGRDSKLTTWLAFSAFSIAIILSGVWFLRDALRGTDLEKLTDPAIAFGFFLGFALFGLIFGLAAVQLVRLIMQPWLSVPSSAVIKLIDALKEDVAQKITIENGAANPQPSTPS